MEPYQFESRLNRPIMMKIPELKRNERLKHIIFSDQFDVEFLDDIRHLSDKIRDISKTRKGCNFLASLLSHKRAMLYFTQVSTRTFSSFKAACQILGMPCNNVRDPSVSSEYKGETPYDSIRMFSSYSDLIIMRTKQPDLAESCAYLMNDLNEFNQRNVPIINGGSGADQHPTQALLDIYTLQREFDFKSIKHHADGSYFEELKQKYPGLSRGMNHKVYGFCGDIGRGRTVRSLAHLLSLYEDVTMYFVHPDLPKLKLPDDLKNKLLKNNVTVKQFESLDDIVDKVDMLYMTRVQHEHDSEADRDAFEKYDKADFILTPERVAKMKDYACIMHPFPRNKEIPTSVDFDPKARYFMQARNGMWVRSALIAYLFDVDSQIIKHHSQTFDTYHTYNKEVL